ncbi:hypothetical protein N7539_003827 [Penicillium diatomitis]|uniref:Uncharacterized protein n=1 Tax=Penicillium diatomitis TaxID=2819901 RepID=A0A9X0BY84_9EURO|nr:uncharacterized protein N7539_003827 [Penicillium diatomitis]KAJ5488937.1 hypothetical protein N7539_003827 [Penicillium diatomitis]
MDYIIYIGDDVIMTRATLRMKHEQAVKTVHEDLKSNSKAMYSREDLTKLRVSLETSDTQDLPGTGTRLFEPMAPDKISRYSFDASKMSKDDREFHGIYDTCYRPRKGTARIPESHDA